MLKRDPRRIKLQKEDLDELEIFLKKKNEKVDPKTDETGAKDNDFETYIYVYHNLDQLNQDMLNRFEDRKGTKLIIDLNWTVRRLKKAIAEISDHYPSVEDMILKSDIYYSFHDDNQKLANTGLFPTSCVVATEKQIYDDSLDTDETKDGNMLDDRKYIRLFHDFSEIIDDEYEGTELTVDWNWTVRYLKNKIAELPNYPSAENMILSFDETDDWNIDDNDTLVNAGFDYGIFVIAKQQQ